MSSRTLSGLETIFLLMIYGVYGQLTEHHFSYRSTCSSSPLSIPSWWACDGHSDCEGGSDEADQCSTRPYFCIGDGMFQCNSATSPRDCLLPHQVCDGRQQCRDGDDELGCANYTCTRGYVKCTTDHKCIPEAQVCDGVAQCSDMEDERSLCHERRQRRDTTGTTLCKANEFKCLSGDCIHKSFACDNTEDCMDGSDESDHCRVAREAPCEEGQFKCLNNGNCIDMEWHCDFEHDCCGDAEECDDHSDEDPEVCRHKHCREDQFLCQSNHCIPTKFQCDGNKDCADGTDEMNCPLSNTTTTMKSTIETSTIEGHLCSGFDCGHGACHLVNGEPHCKCDEFFEGSHCELCQCAPSGSCVVEDNNVTSCNCSLETYGTFCQFDCIGSCGETHVCSQCFYNVTTRLGDCDPSDCICRPGFTGESCDQAVCDGHQEGESNNFKYIVLIIILTAIILVVVIPILYKVISDYLRRKRQLRVQFTHSHMLQESSGGLNVSNPVVYSRYAKAGSSDSEGEGNEVDDLMIMKDNNTNFANPVYDLLNSVELKTDNRHMTHDEVNREEDVILCAGSPGMYKHADSYEKRNKEFRTCA